MRAVKLSVEDVSKSFRMPRSSSEAEPALPVLHGVSFVVHEKEIVSLIGASGCGKTTLLRIVQGLVPLDAGRVAIDGKTVDRPGPDRGIVFQQANLLPWRSAAKNVEFGLEIQGLPKSERTAQAVRLLELVGLKGFEKHYPHQLSGGMQQRIGLARALATDPEVLLMDEPFSALDAQTREVLQRELLAVLERTRKTILFVTHDLDEAIYLSDRIVVMGGRPGGVLKVVEVPFERSRPTVPELRQLPIFQEIRNEIWQLIGSRQESTV
jgi:NitT/TauT family transport system ATP-binding protein